MDTGGPKREFLRLLAIQLTNSPYFQSGSDGSFFSCNTTAYKVTSFLSVDEMYFSLLFRIMHTEYWGSMQQSL